ncbi:MAG TPA: cupin domain-containing protein [Candidatus Acidoferrum sp.]|nr:cupin domain-containing protein [Candidatus Acidoferrum sp.]
MTEPQKYNINLNVKYDHLELIDISAVVAACTDQWFNQALTRVNSSVVRVAIIQGEFHWHKHDNDDEFFFVLDGHLLIDLEYRTIQLRRHEGVTITRGIMHRPRAPQKTVVLLVEPAGIKPTGD